MVFSMLVGLWLAQAPGCTKDTDCKGDRICEAGSCRAPSAPVASEPLLAPPPAPPPTPPEAPADYPRVVRRDGLVCVQSLDAGGAVTESCRKDAPPPRVRPLPARATARDAEDPGPTVTAAPEPGSRFVSDVLVHGGLLGLMAGGSSAALPQLGGSIALGARFRAGVGVAGLGTLSVGFAPGFGAVIGSLVPALRVGDRSHVLLGLGPAVIGFSSVVGGGAGLAGALQVAGVFAVARAFALTLHAAMYVDASGVAFTLGAGFGFGAF